MNTKDGYAKKSLTNFNLLGAGGGDISLLNLKGFYGQNIIYDPLRNGFFYGGENNVISYAVSSSPFHNCIVSGRFHGFDRPSMFGLSEDSVAGHTTTIGTGNHFLWQTNGSSVNISVPGSVVTITNSIYSQPITGNDVFSVEYTSGFIFFKINGTVVCEYPGSPYMTNSLTIKQVRVVCYLGVNGIVRDIEYSQVQHTYWTDLYMLWTSSTVTATQMQPNTTYSIRVGRSSMALKTPDSLLKSGGTMTGALTTPSLTTTTLSVSGAATFSQAINGSILGNAATASRLQNARTISLTGAITGSGNFDGSANLSIATTSNITFSDFEFTGGGYYSEANREIHCTNVNSVVTSKYYYKNCTVSFKVNAAYNSGSSSQPMRIGFCANKSSINANGSVAFVIDNYQGSGVTTSIMQYSNNAWSGEEVSNVGYQYGGSVNSSIFTLQIVDGRACFFTNNSFQGSFAYSSEKAFFFIQFPNTMPVFDISLAPIQCSPAIVVSYPSTGDVLKYNGTYWTNDVDATSSGSNSGITSLTSNILSGSVTSNAGKYEPFSSTTATSTWVASHNNAGRLYLGTQNPSKTTRLNYNGYFYATKLYSGGNEVSTASITLPSSNITLSTSDQVYITVGTTQKKIKLPSTCPWTVGSTTLSGLTDTTISSPSSGQVLKYNGSAWVNSALPLAGSWADNGSQISHGVSTPTLTLSSAAIRSTGTVTKLPNKIYSPAGVRYVAFPVVRDKEGRLFVALPSAIASMATSDHWTESATS